MSKLGLFVVVSSLLIVSSIESSARADVTSGTASAFGVEANVGQTATFGGVFFSSTLSAGPTPTASGTAPPAFNNSNSAFSLVAVSTVGASVQTGFLDVNAQSNVDGTAGTKTTSASADVFNTLLAVRGVVGGSALAGGIVFVAQAIQSTAQVTGDFGALTPSGTTTITLGSGVLRVGGVDLTALVFASATPSPNTTFIIDDTLLGGTGAFTGSLTIVLNEQIVTGDGISTSGITVNAIDITFNAFGSTGLNAITNNGQIIFSQSQAAQAAAPGGGGGAQPVPEPSSLAMLGLAGVAGAIRRYRRRSGRQC